MNKDQKLLYKLSVEKSQQSFLLAIELYNKPTISLNIEGFCIFICNAWELMFKAYMLANNKSIYYKDKQKKNRTYDLSKLMRLIMTNSKDPARMNLETIIGIRNKATHLIIPEYASLLHNVFLANVHNYIEKMQSLLDININELFNHDFFLLSIPTVNNSMTMLGKYGKDIQNEYYNFSKYLNEAYKSNTRGDEQVNDRFAIGYEFKYIKVKNKEDANIKIANYKDNESVKAIKIVKPVDVSETHPLTFSALLKAVQKELNRSGITFNSYTKSGNTNFTSNTLSTYLNIYKIKENQEYAYKHSLTQVSYTYSYSLVEKIVQDISDDPDLFVKYKDIK